MSKALLKWAKKQSVGCPLAKAVLLDLAYEAKPNRATVTATHSEIAQRTEMSLSTAKRAVAMLVSGGFIKPQPRRTARGLQAPNEYTFPRVTLTPGTEGHADTRHRGSERTSYITNLLSTRRELEVSTYPLGSTFQVAGAGCSDLYELIAAEEVPA